MNSELLNSHKWYQDHREEMVSKYRGRYVVIADSAVVGIYAAEDEALRETLKTRKLGTFLVKLCVPADEETPIVFHSRVSFA